jgi:hypothetical protein
MTQPADFHCCDSCECVALCTRESKCRPILELPVRDEMPKELSDAVKEMVKEAA